MKRIFLSALLPVLALQCFAENPAEALKRLEAAVAAKPQEVGPETERAYAVTATQLQRLRTMIQMQDYNSAVEMLQQLLMMLPPSGDARKAASDLLTALTDEATSREQAYKDRATKAIEDAKAVVKSAKTTTDLDAVLAELSALKSQSFSGRFSDGESGQNLRNQLEGAYRFMTRWQDYLAAVASNNTEQTRNILRNLADSDLLLIPRSTLLALSQGKSETEAEPQRPVEETAAELIAGTKRLEDVRNLISKLQALRADRRNTNTISQTIQSLENIDGYYHEYLVGVVPSIESVNNNVSSGYVANLKLELLRTILPRVVGVPNVKCKPGEMPEELLKRIVENAKAAVDLQTAVRAREALRQVLRSSYTLGNDSNVVSTFTTARNQEEAQQWAAAVVSYQSTLKIGSDLVPAKFIGERLEAIRKQHPEDYEKGMERANTPPSYPPYPYSNRPMPNMPGTPGAPGMPGAFPTPNMPGK